MSVAQTTLEKLQNTYNNYAQGLAKFNGNLDHYMVSVGSQTARKNFSKRQVTFIAGSKDFLAAENRPALYLEGTNAAHRALIYKKHLEQVGLWNNNLHNVKIVADAEHNGRQLMSSVSGLQAIFPHLSSCPMELSPVEALGQIGRLVEELLHRIPISDPFPIHGPPLIDENNYF
jgi:hypothetical protein